MCVEFNRLRPTTNIFIQKPKTLYIKSFEMQSDKSRIKSIGIIVSLNLQNNVHEQYHRAIPAAYNLRSKSAVRSRRCNSVSLL